MEGIDPMFWAVVGVGVSLVGLVLTVNHRTNQRIDALEVRLRAVETCLADLRGYIRGRGAPAADRDAPRQVEGRDAL